MSPSVFLVRNAAIVLLLWNSFEIALSSVDLEQEQRPHNNKRVAIIGGGVGKSHLNLLPVNLRNVKSCVYPLT